MHDPKAVAHSIKRPWPNLRSGFRPDPERRWAARYSWAKWYDLRPRVFMSFWTLAGHSVYWPDLITIWHNEPGGHDFGEVCRARKQRPDGSWYYTHGWRWHAHHWSFQIHPWQHFRRWAFTRCEWCGGHSRKGDWVNISHQWDRKRGPWWRGERGLFHHDCSSIERAHHTCTCEVGPWEHLTFTGGQPYGRCFNCGQFRAFRTEPKPLGDQATRILASIPEGRRDPDKTAQAKALWAQQRAAEAAQ